MDIERYNAAGKAPEVFRRQLDSVSDPIYIENFLDAEEVAALLEEERSRPASQRGLRPPVSPVTEITWEAWKETEIRILGARMRELVGDFEVWGGNYFKTYAPYYPHVDTGENIKLASYKNLLFPLAQEGEGETHLVLFKQRYFGDNTLFYRSGKSLSPAITQSGALFDYSSIMYLEDGPAVSTELLEGVLSHLNPEDLTGFSVDRVLPWKVGACYIFDSAQIHCAGNFRKAGIKSKTGLSIFTCR
jgi:hypothetical protein